MSNQCKTVNEQVFSATKKQLEQEKKLALLAKALSHPSRLRALSILMEVDKSSGCLNSDFVTELGIAQSTVSEHLRILKQAELIIAEPMPPKMCYRINAETLKAFSSLFTNLYK